MSTRKIYNLSNNWIAARKKVIGHSRWDFGTSEATRSFASTSRPLQIQGWFLDLANCFSPWILSKSFTWIFWHLTFCSFTSVGVSLSGRILLASSDDSSIHMLVPDSIQHRYRQTPINSKVGRHGDACWKPRWSRESDHPGRLQIWLQIRFSKNHDKAKKPYPPRLERCFFSFMKNVSLRYLLLLPVLP